MAILGMGCQSSDIASDEADTDMLARIMSGFAEDSLLEQKPQSSAPLCSPSTVEEGLHASRGHNGHSVEVRHLAQVRRDQ